MITFDKKGNRVPSKEFLSMIIILLRKCKSETDTNLVQFLEEFDKRDDEFDLVDTEDDFQLRKAIHKYLNDNYPEEK